MGASGPMQFGLPSTVSDPTYNNDPSKFTAFNQTPLMNQATANTNQNIANQQRNIQAQASAAGAGRSAGNTRMQRDANSAGQQAVANQNLEAAKESFGQQLGQQNAANQYNLGEQGLQNQAYNAQTANYLNEQAQRRQAVSQLPGGGLINLFNGPY